MQRGKAGGATLLVVVCLITNAFRQYYRASLLSHAGIAGVGTSATDVCGCYASHDCSASQVAQPRLLAVVSLFDRTAISSKYREDSSAFDRLVAFNHRAYAARHHYTHIDCAVLLERHVADQHVDPWLRSHLRKVLCVRYAMDTGATWVLWIDSDAAFVDLSARVEPLLDHQVDLILSHGGGSLINHWINTGVFLVRATPWARRFFDETATLLRRNDFRDLYPGIAQWRDQKAILMQLLEMSSAERTRHVKVLPRECGHLLQTFPPWFSDRNSDKQFVVHFPGDFKLVGWREVFLRILHDTHARNSHPWYSEHLAPSDDRVQFSAYMEDAMRLAEWVDHVETVLGGTTAGGVPNSTLVMTRLHDVYPAACVTISTNSPCAP